MRTKRSSVEWIRFWMATLTVSALGCGGDPSHPDSDASSGAGGVSDGAGGSPSDSAGGSPSDSAGGSPSDSAGGSPSDSAGGSPSDNAGGSPSDNAGGSPSESAGGSPSESTGGSAGDGAGGSPSDGGDTEVDWLSVAQGSFPGGDSTAAPCTDVEAVLFEDQADLDQWATDQGISNLESESILDWTTETALAAVARCSTSAHMLEGGDLTHDGSGELTAELTVTHLTPSFEVATVVWSVFAVQGRDWTGVSAITLE